jgi:threonine aldolase
MWIDLRSDTVTKPIAEMRKAIAKAEVGDDVHNEDPTVLRLEEKTAAMLGKEAAVFMPSGTMTNQVGLRTHTQPGDEVILEAQAHIYYYEGGGPAALSGVSCRLIQGNHGIFTAEQLVKSFRKPDVHHPTTRLVCLENTHNRGGGRIYPLEEIRKIGALCKERNLALHLDGARLWNASVALGKPEAELVSDFDSISVCFSKGLGAPVGSALAGSNAFIQRARHFRKMFGGGMRQAGIIAAGALYALENHRERLAEDHANARLLAEGLSQVDGLEVDLNSVQTNIVIFQTPGTSAVALSEALEKQGIGMLDFGPEALRAVANLMVSHKQIQQVPEKMAKALKSLR